MSWLRGLIMSAGPLPAGRTVEESMARVMAETVAFQQQLEAQRAAREHLADLDGIDEMPLVDEDAAKAYAAVEMAWLESTPVLQPVTRSVFAWCFVLAFTQSARTFVIRRRWHMRRH